MKVALLLLLASSAFAGQSVILNTSSVGNSSVPAQSGDCRVEGLLQNWASSPTTAQMYSSPCGTFFGFSSSSQIQVYWQRTIGGSGPCVGNPYIIVTSGYSPKALYYRYQQSIAGNSGAGFATMTDALEVWDSTGVEQYSKTCTYTALTGANSNGATVSSGTSSDQFSTGFYRAYNTLVPMGYQMPTTAPALPALTGGCLFHWKFDGNLADACGSYPASQLSGTSSYAPTGTIQNLILSIPRTLNAPTWSNWISMNATPGASNQLDGTFSFSQIDASAAVSYQWTHQSGPSTPTYSSPTAGQPTLTNISFGSYDERLLVTDSASNSNYVDLAVGAVAYNGSGVVTPADPNVTTIYGPLVAFGQNPWGYMDERQLYMIGAQTGFQANNYDPSWTTPGQGTVSYPFAGKGVSPGSACTTLSGSITATTLSIPVTNATCLSLSSLPTWILIGNSAAAEEMVRICSTTGTTGAQTLTACYDGRGMAGNSVPGIGGYPNVVNSATCPTPSATSGCAWASTVKVGEMRIQGTSTLFHSDLNRPVCPAGIPGPIGQVVYSAGTATLTASSLTVTGGSTAWTTAMVGAFIRVQATHASGSPFIWWDQIAAVNAGTQVITTSGHLIPSDIDGTAFSYAITGNWITPNPPGSTGGPSMYLSLEFTWTDGHIARGLQNGVGCESETAMFALPTHDITAIDTTTMSGVHFSYKTFLGAYIANSNFESQYYGVGIAARNFWLRSGYGPALTLANFVDETWVRDPEVGDGIITGIGSPLDVGGPAIGGIIDLVLNPSTVLTWPNVRQFAINGEIGSGPYANCNYDDTRDTGYMSSQLTLVSLFDTTYAGSPSWNTALEAVSTRDQACIRPVSTYGTGAGFPPSAANSFANNAEFSTSVFPQALTLTNNSTAVTGTAFTASMCAGVVQGTITVTAGSSAATIVSITVGSMEQGDRIWITDTTSSPLYVGGFEYKWTSGAPVTLAGLWPGASGTFNFMAEGTIANGQAAAGYMTTIWTDNNDTVSSNLAQTKPWACQYNSSSSLTLNRPWDGTTGSSYHLDYFTVMGFVQEPFFVGIQANKINWASKSQDSTVATNYAPLGGLVGQWMASYGIDSNTNGVYYARVNKLCEPFVTATASPQFDTIHGWDLTSQQPACGLSGLLAPQTERINSVEAGAAMLQFYIANPTPANRMIVDKYYTSVYGYCPYTIGVACDPTISFGDPNQQLTNSFLNYFKWPGFFFGMGGFFSSGWPAIRTIYGFGSPALSGNYTPSVNQLP